MATNIGQYAPVFLPGEPPLSDREAWQATVYRVAKSWTGPKGPARIDARIFFFFVCSSSAPVRVELEGGAASWLGTLAAPSVQGHKLALLQELWPYQSFLKPLIAGNQKASLASLSP